MISIQDNISPAELETLFAQHGAKVFTTLRTYLTKKNALALLHLDYHLERLTKSAEHLNILAPTAQEFSNQLQTSLTQALSANAEQLKRIRILLDNESTMIALENVADFNSEPIKLCSVYAERSLPEHKTTSNVASIWAMQEAHKRGTNEALFIDRVGIVRECAWSNLFWFKADGTLCTTDQYILHGVTRRIVLSLQPAEVCHPTFEEFIEQASEVFVTQSTTGIRAVTHIDQRKIGSQAPGPHTRNLSDKFQQYISEHVQAV